MENEQEGIEIETLNPDEEGIVLPDVETEENDVEEVEETETTEETEVDTEKELLKKGVNEERAKRKAAERKARELEARIKALEDSQSTPKKTTVEELVENGIDESVAKTIAQAIDKKQDGYKKTEQELADLRFENSISKISKKEGFEDIEEYVDEIKPFVDKGLTIEQAYYALTGGKSNNTKSEIERKIEAKLETKQARKEMLKNINSSVGTNVDLKTNSKPKATAEEVAIAKAAGISVEDYIAARDIDNVKDYERYTKSKK